MTFEDKIILVVTNSSIVFVKKEMQFIRNRGFELDKMPGVVA